MQLEILQNVTFSQRICILPIFLHSPLKPNIENSKILRNSTCLKSTIIHTPATLKSKEVVNKCNIWLYYNFDWITKCPHIFSISIQNTQSSHLKIKCSPDDILRPKSLTETSIALSKPKYYKTLLFIQHLQIKSFTFPPPAPLPSCCRLKHKELIQHQSNK